MKAAFLIRHGEAKSAFEIRDTEKPTITPSQILIKVEAFGLNFADVMARLGLYRDAPSLPSVLGYDVVGRVEEVGDNIEDLAVGDRVMALTRFGGYAEYAIGEQDVVHKISESLSPGVATALSTQYSTAYFLAFNMANLQKGDRILIHAAAGGVGTGLVQMAKFKGCEIFGTCGSEEKIEFIKEMGVDHPINYRTRDFEDYLGDKKLDVIFDPIGGNSLKKGFRSLSAGGRIISYGLSSMNQAKSIFGKIKVLWQFGFYHPVQFLSGSKGIIGVNMLKLGEERPEKLARVMEEVIKLAEAEILKPHVGGEFQVEELAEAHAFLESRKSVGKIVVKW